MVTIDGFQTTVTSKHSFSDALKTQHVLYSFGRRHVWKETRSRMKNSSFEVQLYNKWMNTLGTASTRHLLCMNRSNYLLKLKKGTIVFNTEALLHGDHFKDTSFKFCQNVACKSCWIMYLFRCWKNGQWLGLWAKSERDTCTDVLPLHAS